MSIFISQGKYTQAAMAGMVAKPEDRQRQVAGLVSRAGGKLVAYYVTMGEYDWIAIADMPDASSMLSVIAAAAAGGSISDTKTIAAFSGADAKKALAAAAQAASGFRSAGQA